MPKVFVINQPAPSRAGQAYDVSPAMKHGEIHFIFSQTSPQPSRDMNAAIDHAYDVLKAVHPQDYIVWAGGDPLSMLIVAGIIADKLEGKFRYLKWERARDEQGNRISGGYYLPVQVELWND